MFSKYLIFIASIFFAFNNLSASPPPLSMEQVIAEIEKAADPHNTGKDIKTLITVIELSIPAQQIKMLVTVKDKFPDKSKKTTEIPGLTSITNIINNDEAWEISPAGVRNITGKELEFNKFQLLMKNPTKKMKDVFKDIKFETGSFKIADDECIKLICTPKSDLKFSPINMFFSKKTFLLRRIEMILESSAGIIPVTTTIEEYKKIQGRMIPVKTKTSQAETIIESKLISAKENIGIPDSEFANPTPVEVYK